MMNKTTDILKTSLLLITLIILVPNSGFSQNSPEFVIEFLQDDWEQAVKQAKAQEKLIFVDAYTTWCGPCRMMSKKIFTNDRVADFYNSNFVNLKVNMEKKLGPKFKEQYGIQGYPTLLFLRPDGTLVKKAIGYHQVASFLHLGKRVLNSED